MTQVDIAVTTGTDGETTTGENIGHTTKEATSTGTARQGTGRKAAIEIAMQMVDEPTRLLRAIPLMFAVLQPLPRDRQPVESLLLSMYFPVPMDLIPLNRKHR
jgi:hypothetical protein